MDANQLIAAIQTLFPQRDAAKAALENCKKESQAAELKYREISQRIETLQQAGYALMQAAQASWS